MVSGNALYTECGVITEAGTPSIRELSPTFLWCCCFGVTHAPLSGLPSISTGKPLDFDGIALQSFVGALSGDRRHLGFPGIVHSMTFLSNTEFHSASP